MRSDIPTGVGERTFTESARRAQIVGAAIDTIAEVGFSQASLSRIAERIGVSKGVISYHFTGKDDLVREVLATVVGDATAYMRPRIEAESTGTGILRALIESNIGFMAENPNHLIAFVSVAENLRGTGGRPGPAAEVLAPRVAALRELLARFQATGEFRPDFDPAVMASAIRAAIDAVPPRLGRDPGLDLALYGRELAELFVRATRAEPAPGAGGGEPGG